MVIGAWCVTDGRNVKSENVDLVIGDWNVTRRAFPRFRHGPITNHHRAFTLIELLVVIGIIVVLIAILLPVAVAVRKASYVTATQQEINRIAAACQAYYQDFRAYPGPLPEAQVVGGAATLTAPTITLGTTPYPLTGATNITSSENLVLGLLGGLQFTTTPATAFTYVPALVGQGPQSLNTVANSQKQTSSYLPEVTTGSTELAPTDGSGNYLQFSSADSAVPEFYDHIPGSIVATGTGVTPSGNFDFGPIIYLRARVASTGIVDTAPPTPPTSPQQYSFAECAPYAFTMAGNGGNGVNINDFPGTNVPSGDTAYTPVTAYFANPSIYNQPKSKDSFILISAGSDRIFGTKDDIIYSN